jgi:hypothetical protein
MPAFMEQWNTPRGWKQGNEMGFHPFRINYVAVRFLQEGVESIVNLP